MSFRFILLQVVTLARIPLAIVIVALLMNFPPTWALLVGCMVLLGLAELTDAMDGWLARRWSLTSEFGATLDPYSDSIARLIVYWGFACSGLANPIVPLVMALRDVSVAYCRIDWIRKGKSAGAQLSGKIKAVVQAIAAFVFILNAANNSEWRTLVVQITSWTVILVTAASGCDYGLRTLKGNLGEKS